MDISNCGTSLSNEPPIFNILNDDYNWFNELLNDKSFRNSFKRDKLNQLAIPYNINPQEYKNKKLLLEQLVSIWNNYFNENPDFKKKYYEFN